MIQVDLEFEQELPESKCESRSTLKNANQDVQMKETDGAHLNKKENKENDQDAIMNDGSKECERQEKEEELFKEYSFDPDNDGF